MNFMQMIYFYAFSNFFVEKGERERGLYIETIIMVNVIFLLKKVMYEYINLGFFSDEKFFRHCDSYISMV